MFTRSISLLLAGAAISGAGCAHEEMAYGPPMEQAPPAAPQGPATATYPVPAAAPKGNLHVLSLGAEPMAAGAQGGSSMFLHIRLAAENNGDAAPWTIEAHEQTISFGAAPAMPTYAQSSAGGPVLTVAPGARGTLDLYYAMPGQAGAPSAVVGWRLRRGDEVIAQNTDFQLHSAPNSQYVDYQPLYHPGVTVAVVPGWWWYDDWYWYRGYGAWGWGPYGYYYPYWGYGYPRYRGYYGGGRVWVGGSARIGGGVGVGGAWRGTPSVNSAPRSSGGGRSGWRGGGRR